MASKMLRSATVIAVERALLSAAPRPTSLGAARAPSLTAPSCLRRARWLGWPATGPRHLATAASSNVPSAYGDRPYDVALALDANGRIPSMPYVQDPLPGTAPEYKAHIIVHPFSRPRPPSTWPAAIESVSPIISELNSRRKAGGSLEGYGVTFSSGELGDQTAPSDGLSNWDIHTPKVMRAVPGGEQSEEQYLLYVYLPPGRFATVGPVSLDTLDEGKSLKQKIEDALAAAKPQTAKRKAEDEAHIYVCTHGMRDCRCGVVGEALLQSLRKTYEDENAASGGALKPTKFFAVAHVGGHKWAATALVYPHGDWYGNLREYDAGLLLRAAQAPASSMHDLSDQREKMVHWSRWRGRLGLSDDKMRTHYDHWGPPLMQSAVLTPAMRVGKPSRPEAADAAPAAAAPSQTSAPAEGSAAASGAGAGGAAVPLRFRSFEGQWFDVEGRIGENLKDVAKRYALPSIEATCGGECECATCHAYFAPATADPQQKGDIEAEPPAFLGEPADEENDMLDYAITRTRTSRLLCQVPVTQELSDWMTKQGGRIELPRF